MHTNSSTDVQLSDLPVIQGYSPRNPFLKTSEVNATISLAPEETDCIWECKLELFSSFIELKNKNLCYINAYSFLTRPVLHSVCQICTVPQRMFTAGHRDSAWHHEAFCWERASCYFPVQILTYPTVEIFSGRGFLISSHLPSPILMSSSCHRFHDGHETRKFLHEHN